MTPAESHHEIRKTGHRWIDISVAACALTVSITSLFVAVRHGRSMERMAEANARLVQANSWPLLQRYHSDVGEQGAPVFSLDVANNGVGHVERLLLLGLLSGPSPIRDAGRERHPCQRGRLVRVG